MKIINPWKSRDCNHDYEVGKPIYAYGDYAIYKQYDRCYLYAYKNMAFNQLAGINKEHLRKVADRSGLNCLYCRALQNLNWHGVN